VSDYFIGIDIGGTVTKAALFDSKGNEIAVGTNLIESVSPEPKYVERNMVELWDLTAKSINDVLKTSAINPDEIIAISVTGHGNGLYLIDEKGDPVYNAVYSSDMRASEYVEKWKEDGTLDSVKERTLQTNWSGQSIALLAWFRDNMPEVLEDTRWILTCKDYIRYRLTNKISAEITDMSSSCLMNLRDGKYDEALLEDFGLEELIDKFPPLIESTKLCGPVTKEAAKQTGLSEGKMVVAGLTDIDATMLGSGIVDNSMLCLIAGTWSITEYLTENSIIDNYPMITTIHCDDDYYLLSEATPTSASNLEWFINRFLEKEQKEANDANESVYNICNKFVEETEPEESRIIYLPYLFGSNVNADAKASFIGLNNSHKKEHILRAVYEGMIFAHKMDVDKLLNSDNTINSVRLSGGASRSSTIAQMYADILQTPIETTNCAEKGALGTVINAAVGLGYYSDFKNAIDAMVQKEDTFLPNRRLASIYNEKFNQFKKVIELLNSFW